jgi:putative ABC transport system substrate-binding protein
LNALGTLLPFPWARLALAQTTKDLGKQMRVGILTTGTGLALRQTLVEALRELGWVEGRNIAYEGVNAGGDPKRLPEAAAALVAKGPDVIYVTANPEVLALLAVTRTIPIVSAALVDPVEIGLIKSLARPGGNLTGVATLGAETTAKRMEITKDLLPQLRRVGFLMTSTALSAVALKRIERTAGPGIKVISAIANEPAELEAAFTFLTENRIEALLLAQVGWTQGTKNRKRIIDFALNKRIPLIAHRSVLTDDGALLSYNSSLEDQRRRAAHLADKILKGAKPADIPVEQPTIFELVINMKIAKALGITIPPMVMVQATRVIE